MDKKLHEELNRIRKLSGLVEDDTTWTERLPDGRVRTHHYGYSDEKPGIPAWDSYKDKRVWGQGSTSSSSDAGTGSGEQGSSRAAGTPGNGQGAGQQGNNRGQGITGGGPGTNSGPGNSYNSTTGDGQNYTVTPGAGPGGLNRIQRIDPGSTGFSTGPGRGGNTSITIDRPGPGDTEYSPGIPGGSDDGDMDSNYSTPIRPEKPSKNSKSKQQRSDPEDDPSYDAYPEAPKYQYKDISKEPSPYVNPAWQKEQDRIKQQQQQPLPSATTSLGKLPPKEPVKVEPPKEVPNLPSATTSLGKAPPTGIAKDLLLKEPPKEVPNLPSATTSLGKLPAPAPKVEPPKVEPPKEIPNLPSATTSLGKLPPKPMPAAKPPETTVVKHDEKQADNTITPAHPGMTVNAPTDSKPVDTSTVGSGKTTPVATPSPILTGPKIDLPVVDLTPTHPDRPTKPDSSTPDAVDLHMVQEPPSKEPGIAQQILLPKNEPAPEPKASITAPIPPPTATPTKTNEPTPGEIVPMSQADQEKIFGPMPGQSSSSAPAPAKKGNNGGGKAGSGSPSSSTAGGSEPGTSGEKGASSSGEPWARPLVLKPGETPRGKFDDPGRVGAPDFKGTLLNPGTLPTPIPGMPDPDLNGRVNPTPNPTPAGSGGKGVTLQPGDDPTDKSEIPDLVIHGPGNKSNEGMERMLQLAGIKESTKVERQFLQESTVNKPNNIADTFKRLAGLK